ncbi:F0F1 ATP synthase subunit gamma [Acidimangrovimonas sediminis]|uniref:F0F1 ATP synthase subunit gamma n=1 Tax=Acidimangrovimonas sediminis TaxID=2056283 RepID=UPI000C7FAEF2|nr:F0F1 ATP synthase subunit gamma [Acidimangrovimonas sediminis]
MEQEQALRARIASLTELRGLFQALRVLAASRLQEALAALPGIRAYSDIVTEALADGRALDPPGLASGEDGAAALIVICAEHGFVGGLNAALLDEASTSRRPDEALIVTGKRGGALAAERGMAPALVLPAATHVSGVTDVTHDLAAALAGRSSVRAVFGRHERGGGYAVAARRVLPPDPSADTAPGRPQPPGPHRAPPLVQLPPADLLAALEREYLFAALSQALMESFASENAARLRVMEAADRSIADKLDRLARVENEIRQEAITSELLDVATGAQAILG